MDSATKLNRKKRIMTDLQRLREPTEPHLPKYDIRQDRANDLNVIYTEIRGPKDSFYEGGYFVLRFEFTNDYPVSSPSVAFITKVWHPNVDHNSGSICLNSLNQMWQPTVNLRHILDTHMPWLLRNGNPDDPLNTEAGQQMKNKDPKYGSIVRQWVKRHAHQSRLKEYGSVWYKDQPKKKKKKKKFNLSELTQQTTTTTTTATAAVTTSPCSDSQNNSNHNMHNNVNHHHHGQHTQSVTPSMSAQSTPHIKACTPLSSMSMGHIEYTTTTKGAQQREHQSGGGGGGVDVCDFQDWWRGAKNHPNTPSKSGHGQPQIRRTQSFQNRPDSSPWLSKRPMRRAASDAVMICDDSDNYEDDMQMQLFSLQNDDHEEDDNSRVAVHSHRSRRLQSAQDDDRMSTKRDKHRKKRGVQTRRRQPSDGNDALYDAENSELSSMDEDPTYDLEQYQSLTSLEIASLSGPRHVHSSNSRSSREQQRRHHHHHHHVAAQQAPSSIMPYTATTSAFNYSYSSSVSLRSLSSRPPYFDSVVSKSAGFMPQNVDHFICPEFSPLSPDKPMLPSSGLHTSTERILHFSPTLTAQKCNTHGEDIKTALFLNDNHHHDHDQEEEDEEERQHDVDLDIDINGDDEDDDDGTQCTTSAVRSHKKLMNKHGDVDMTENNHNHNKNSNGNGCNVLIHDGSNRMSMD